MESLKKINKILDRNLKIYLIFIFFIIFLTMLLETISLASFYPLLEILTSDLNQINDSRIKKFFFNILNHLNIDEKNIFSTIVMIVSILFISKILVLLFCYWHGSNFAFTIRFYLTKILYKTYLTKDYRSLMKYNSADIIKNIDYEIHMFGSGVVSMMIFLTEGFIFLAILIFLFFFNIKTTLTILLISFLIFIILQLSYNKLLLIWAETAQKHHKSRTKNFLETFNAIKEIKIFRKENLFYNLMHRFNQKFFNANRNQRFLTNIPKAVIESSVIIIISIYLVNLHSLNYDFKNYFSQIGIYLIAGYRVFPSMNRIIVSLQSIKFASPYIENITNQILSENIYPQEGKLTFKNQSDLKFEKSIELRNCSFSFNREKQIIKNLSLKFETGKIYGIKGASGSGKTTLLNILSGLIVPNSGKIFLDEKEINKDHYLKLSNVSYVPQSVFLFDTTIAKNVHFNFNDVSSNEFKNILTILKELGLEEKISSLSSGLDTNVGERGVNLSGGQTQRIGLARAIYHKPKLLILDEATNAIEKDLETKVLKYLNSLKKNMIIILAAHRESAFENCDKIYQID